MKKIFEQLRISARKASTQWIDTLVGNCIDIRSPAMSIPKVADIQLDATLDPGASPVYGDAYIITDIENLHANFIVAANVANNDIVYWDGKAFVVAIAATTAASKGLIIKTYVSVMRRDYILVDDVWAAITAGLDTASDTVITGSWTFDIVNEGVQCLTTDDPTLAAATYLFGTFYDHSDSPDYIYNYNMVGFGTVGSTGYYGYRQLNTGVAASVLCAGDTAAGEATIAVSVNGVGDSQCNITGDLIQVAGVLKCTGGKTGTLIAPPANLIIGEVWADTTDSAVHPIYRISTVNT